MFTYTLKTFFFFWILKVEKIVNYVKVLGINMQLQNDFGPIEVCMG